MTNLGSIDQFCSKQHFPQVDAQGQDCIGLFTPLSQRSPCFSGMIVHFLGKRVYINFHRFIPFSHRRRGMPKMQGLNEHGKVDKLWVLFAFLRCHFSSVKSKMISFLLSITSLIIQAFHRTHSITQK